MKNINKILFACIIAFCATMIISACNKKFDEPPTTSQTLESLGVRATITIDSFKVSHKANSGQFLFIQDSSVIVGRVVANDRSGNFYKQIYLQDESGAIEVDIEGTGLYNSFPEGREVAILCKDLYVANVGGMLKICLRTIQNGSPSVIGINPAQFNRFVRLGAVLKPMDPKVVTLSQLTEKLLGSLIRLEDYEFPHPTELFYTYSDSSVNKNTVNVDIQNCSGERVIIRTSAYANFAALPVPRGRGSVTAIYTQFVSGSGFATRQLLIRDTTDLNFNGPRCNPSELGPTVLKTVKEIRDMAATGTPLSGNMVIEGTIVSSTANEAERNYRIQDASGYGIQLRFTSAANKFWNLGDKLRVFFADGLVVAPFNGDLQVNNVPGAVILGQGSVVPRVTTIADLNANINDWASTVVTLKNVTITPSGSSGNYTVSDGTGSVVTFIRTALNYTPPASASSFTGYASVYFGATQVTIRKASDIIP